MRRFDAALCDDPSAIENEGEGESRCEDETELDLLPILRGLLLLSIARRPLPLPSTEIMPYWAIKSVADPSPSTFAILMYSESVWILRLVVS